VAAARLRRTNRTVIITLPGGDFHRMGEATNHVLMTGPATFEYEGRFGSGFICPAL